mmetsp:Transcript_5409/g.10147  ORF Transcript_5409/g.10147 Transcript_5409/m.10147 type:complete len:387 (-) Transcript_5409:48-1208(-)
MGPRSSKLPSDDQQCSRVSSGRNGSCRLCFEGGGDLIAPCLCKGSSKWIHRACLDRWRTAGANPRSLTNCCECGFQYHLELVCQTSSPEADAREERSQRFMRMLAAQGLGCFVLVQAIVFSLGLIARGLDPHEQLVRFFHFHQEADGYEPGDLHKTLEQHKLTYYTAGVLLLLVLIGLTTSVALCQRFCCRGHNNDCTECCEACCTPTYSGRSYYSGRSTCMCADCTNMCVDCGYICQNCACEFGACPDLAGCNTASGEAVLILFALIMVAFILAGIFAVVVAVVTGIQKALQQYAQLQQMRLLAQEYVVQDLAEASDRGDVESAGVPGQVQGMDGSETKGVESRDPELQRELQRQITVDLNSIFTGISQPNNGLRSRASSYGSTR